MTTTQHTDTPQPDWAALGWITHRQPTADDADGLKEVVIPTAIARPRDRETCVCDYQLVVPGQPWWSVNAPERFAPTASPPAPAEPDRIAALEKRVTELKRGEDAAGLFISHFQSRLEKLEGVQADGSAPRWTLNRIAALEQRVAELEAAMQPPTEPPEDISSRRVVQMTFDAVDAERSCLIAICNDGSMWRFPTIPKP